MYCVCIVFSFNKRSSGPESPLLCEFCSFATARVNHDKFVNKSFDCPFRVPFLFLSYQSCGLPLSLWDLSRPHLGNRNLDPVQNFSKISGPTLKQFLAAFQNQQRAQKVAKKFVSTKGNSCQYRHLWTTNAHQLANVIQWNTHCLESRVYSYVTQVTPDCIDLDLYKGLA